MINCYDIITLLTNHSFVSLLDFTVVGVYGFPPYFAHVSLELVLEYLRSPLPREASLFEAQLTHFQVVPSGQQEQWLLVWVELELTNDPLSVKVSVPPPLSVIQVIVLRGMDEWYSEVPLLCWFAS